MRKIHVTVLIVLALGAPASAQAQAEPSDAGPLATLDAGAVASLAPPPATPDEVLDRAGDAARDLAAGRWVLGIGGLLWAAFTLLRLPTLGGLLGRVSPQWRPLLVLAAGLLAAGAFASAGEIPPDLAAALGLGGAGAAMGAHDLLGPTRRRARRGPT